MEQEQFENSPLDQRNGRVDIQQKVDQSFIREDLVAVGLATDEAQNAVVEPIELCRLWLKYQDQRGNLNYPWTQSIDAQIESLTIEAKQIKQVEHSLIRAKILMKRGNKNRFTKPMSQKQQKLEPSDKSMDLNRFTNMLDFCRKQKSSKQTEQPQSLQLRIRELRKRLTEPVRDEDELWTENAQQQHQILTDTAQKVKDALKDAEKNIKTQIRKGLTIELDIEDDQHGSYKQRPDVLQMMSPGSIQPNPDISPSDNFTYDSPEPRGKRMDLQQVQNPIDEESPPKKPAMKSRELPAPMQQLYQRRASLSKEAAKRLVNNLNQIDSILEEKLSSFQETMSGYGTGAGKNAYDNGPNTDVISIKSSNSKSSFYNYKKLNEPYKHRKRERERSNQMEQSPQNIAPSALKQIRMFIDRNSQLSPQVKGKLNFFFESEGMPLHQLGNSYMNGMINKEQHEQLRQIITPKAQDFFNSDQAEGSKNGSSYQSSSQQVSPEEKLNISKFYDKFQMSVNDKGKTQELLKQTMEKSKELQREVDPSYFNQTSARSRGTNHHSGGVIQSQYAGKKKYNLTTAKKPKKIIDMVPKTQFTQSKKQTTALKSGLEQLCKDFIESPQSARIRPGQQPNHRFKFPNLGESSKSSSISPDPQSSSNSSIEKRKTPLNRKLPITQFELGDLAQQEALGQSPQGNFTQRLYESPEHQLSPDTILQRNGYEFHQQQVPTSHFENQLNLASARKKNNEGYVHPKFSLPLGKLSQDPDKSGGGFKIKLQNTGRRDNLDQSLSSIESYSLESVEDPSRRASEPMAAVQGFKRVAPNLVLLDTDPVVKPKPASRIKKLCSGPIKMTPIKQCSNPLREYSKMQLKNNGKADNILLSAPVNDTSNKQFNSINPFPNIVSSTLITRVPNKMIYKQVSTEKKDVSNRN